MHRSAVNQIGHKYTCLIALMLLNWLGLRTGSRVQEITSLTKALALICRPEARTLHRGSVRSYLAALSLCGEVETISRHNR